MYSDFRCGSDEMWTKYKLELTEMCLRLCFECDWDNWDMIQNLVWEILFVIPTIKPYNLCKHCLGL